MSTNESVYGNYARFEMEGMVALSAAGAVSSYTGDGVTVTKNGTGLYDVVVANPSKLKLVTVLGVGAALVDATIGTVKDVGVEATVTQRSTDDAFLMTLHTVDAAGADVDEATSALSISWSFVIQTARMTNPLS